MPQKSQEAQSSYIVRRECRAPQPSPSPTSSSTSQWRCWTPTSSSRSAGRSYPPTWTSWGSCWSSSRAFRARRAERAQGGSRQTGPARRAGAVWCSGRTRTCLVSCVFSSQRWRHTANRLTWVSQSYSQHQLTMFLSSDQQCSVSWLWCQICCVVVSSFVWVSSSVTQACYSYTSTTCTRERSKIEIFHSFVLLCILVI